MGILHAQIPAKKPVRVNQSPKLRLLNHAIPLAKDMGRWFVEVKSKDPQVALQASENILLGSQRLIRKITESIFSGAVQKYGLQVANLTADDLHSHANIITLRHVIPNFDASKGDFSDYLGKSLRNKLKDEITRHIGQIAGPRSFSLHKERVQVLETFLKEKRRKPKNLDEYVEYFNKLRRHAGRKELTGTLSIPDAEEIIAIKSLEFSEFDSLDAPRRDEETNSDARLYGEEFSGPGKVIQNRAFRRLIETVHGRERLSIVWPKLFPKTLSRRERKVVAALFKPVLTQTPRPTFKELGKRFGVPLESIRVDAVNSVVKISIAHPEIAGFAKEVFNSYTYKTTSRTVKNKRELVTILRGNRFGLTAEEKELLQRRYLGAPGVLTDLETAIQAQMTVNKMRIMIGQIRQKLKNANPKVKEALGIK